MVQHSVAAPTPKKPKVAIQLPPLHLEALDLSHPGATAFFACCTAAESGSTGGSHKDGGPHAVIGRAIASVLMHLCVPIALSESSGGDVEADSKHELLKAGKHHQEVRSVTLQLKPYEGVAETSGNFKDGSHKRVRLSTSYLNNVDASRRTHELQGVLVHELVHAYQFDGKGTAPGGLIEGVADWVRLKAGLAPPHWVRGRGDRWDGGYDCTAFFLEYIERQTADPLFVPKLNHALRRRTWEDGKLLEEFLPKGKTVEQVWKEYKDATAGKSEEEEARAPVPTHR